jgi:DNA polymerase-3 subunit gamma/tau
MMATTELQKIPETVLSRSQVYEFRTISAKTVADRLRYVADEEKITIPDDAVMLLARAGEGSMRDSLSAFDQVRAFAGDAISVDDVVTVLGLIGRDLVFETLEAVASEDAPAAFALVERAIERGYDLRMFCKELARATRDLLILSVDPSRANDPDVAAEGERDRLKPLAAKSSREDLLRAFDVLVKAEQEVKTSDQPRYNVEMALLRLMHLRKLTPLSDLISQQQRIGGAAPAPRPAAPPASTSARMDPPRATADKPSAPSDLKAAFLAQVKAQKVFFYNTVVAAAYKVDVNPARITFTFLPNQRVPKQQCEDARAWLEGIAERVAGKKIPVGVTVAEGSASAPVPAAVPAAVAEPARASEEELRQQAMSDPGVQALFEIFPVEKSKVEEM